MLLWQSNKSYSTERANTMETVTRTSWNINTAITTHVELKFTGDTWEQDLVRVLNAETLTLYMKKPATEDELYWVGNIYADNTIVTGVVVHINSLEAQARFNKYYVGGMLMIDPDSLRRDKVCRGEDYGVVDFIVDVI